MRIKIFRLIMFWVFSCSSAVLCAQEQEVGGESAQSTSDASASPNNQKDNEPSKDARDIRNRQVAGPLKKSETIDLSDTIVGNQEQPTVLYIVPWKDAQDTTILYLPLSSKALEELFGHVDRVEHQRQVQFIEKLDQ